MDTPSNDSGIEACERRAGEGSSSRKSTYCPPLATPDDGSGGILVIDDQELIRSLLRMTLQQEGYVVAEAANGAEALLVTRMTRPELILLDWNMPVLNGADFAAAYRQEPGAHAPIVLMTAATRPEHRAAELGAADFLTKPFLIASLVEMVARFVSAGSPPRGVESGARA